MSSTLTLVMSEREFGEVFAKLALQLRWRDADLVTIHAYYAVLSELPLSAVKTAADRFARETDRKFPPTSAEWFSLAKSCLTDAHRRAELPPGRTDFWRVECAACEDTGWVAHLECDGGAAQWPETLPKEPRGNQDRPGNRRPVGHRSDGRETSVPRAATCGRDKPHFPHTYTRACGCRATNRTYQRKHGAAADFS